MSGRQGEGVTFSSIDEVRFAFDAGELDIHARIKVRIDDVIYDTTTGRVLLWETIPGDVLLNMSRIRTETLEDAEAALAELKAGEDFDAVLGKFV